MFEVYWEQTAVNELAAIWIQCDSPLRQIVNHAAEAIERRLERNPLGESESRPDGRRILFELPLGVLFRIRPDGRTVSVLHVWLVRRRAHD